MIHHDSTSHIHFFPSQNLTMVSHPCQSTSIQDKAPLCPKELALCLHRPQLQHLQLFCPNILSRLPKPHCHLCHLLHLVYTKVYTQQSHNPTTVKMDSALHNATIDCSTVPPERARLILHPISGTHQLDASFNPFPNLRHLFNTHPKSVGDPLIPLLPSSCHDFHLNLPRHLLIPIHVAHVNKLATRFIQMNQPLLHQGLVLSTKLVTPSFHLPTETIISTNRWQEYMNYFQDHLRWFAQKLQSTMIHVFSINVVKTL